MAPRPLFTGHDQRVKAGQSPVPTAEFGASNPFASRFGGGGRSAMQVIGAGLMGAAGQGDTAISAIQADQAQQAQQGQDAQLQAAAQKYHARADEVGAGRAFQELFKTDPASAMELQDVAKFRIEQEQAPKRDLREVGGQLVEVMPDGTARVVHGEAEDKRTASQREAAEAGMSTLDYKKALAAAGRAQGSSTTVNLSTPEGKNLRMLDTGYKQLEGLNEQVSGLGKILPEIQEMGKAIRDGAHQPGFGPEIGVKTPWGTVGVDVEAATIPFLQAMSKVGLVDEGRLSQTEVFSMIRSRLAPLMRVPGSGSTSDMEVKMFMDALPSLSRSREGNLKIVEFYERVMSRNIQEMELLEEMLAGETYSPSAYRRKTMEISGELFNEDEERFLESASALPDDDPSPATSPSVTGTLPPATAAPAAPAGAVTPEAIGQMQREQLMMLDTTKLSPELRQAALNRMMALGM